MVIYLDSTSIPIKISGTDNTLNIRSSPPARCLSKTDQ